MGKQNGKELTIKDDYSYYMYNKIIYWMLLVILICFSTYYSFSAGLILVIILPIIAMDVISKKINLENSREPNQKELNRIMNISSKLNGFEDFFISSSIKGGLYSPGIFSDDIIIISEELFEKPDLLSHIVAHEIGHSKKYSRYLIIFNLFFPLIVVFLISIFSQGIGKSILISILITPLISVFDSFVSRKIEMKANEYCWDNDMEDFEYMILSARKETDKNIVKKIFNRSPTSSYTLSHYIDYKNNKE